MPTPEEAERQVRDAMIEIAAVFDRLDLPNVLVPVMIGTLLASFIEHSKAPPEKAMQLFAAGMNLWNNPPSEKTDPTKN